MGRKWQTVSTATYADGSPTDDGAATEANRVKYTTIRTDLTDPLDAAIDSIVSNLDELFDESTVAVSTNTTTVASDHSKIFEVTGAKTITLVAALAGYRVGVKSAAGDIITVDTSGAETIDGETSATVPANGLTWFYANAAADGYTHNPDYRPVLGTELSASGNTSLEFTGIPSWVTKIDIMVDSLSSNTADIIGVELGDASSWEQTDYVGGGTGIGVSVTSYNYSSRFVFANSNADADVFHGIVSLTKMDTSNTWIASLQIGESASANINIGSGRKTLTGALTRVRVISNGVDTFDLGSANVRYS